MAKVSELKDRARALEKKGELEKALQIYQHVLGHLEGSPAIKRELPMYVKAGDLLLKLDDKSGAVESYEKAAVQYAEHGSSKSILALAGKVLGVDPLKADFHLVHARTMLEHGHVGAARDVMADYADRSALEKTQKALEALEGRADDGVKPLLEMILDSAERGERTSTEEAAKRVSVQLGDGLLTLDQLPTGGAPDVSQQATAGETPPEPKPEPEPQPEPEQSEPVSASADVGTAEERPSSIEAPPLDLSANASSDDLVEHGAPSPKDGVLNEPDGSMFATPVISATPAPPPQRPSPVARKPSGVIGVREERKSGVPVWVWGAVGVVVVGGGAAFVMMRGGADDTPPVPVQTQQPAPAIDPTVVPDSLRLDGEDSLALVFMDSVGLDPPGVDSIAIDSAAVLDSAETFRNDSVAAPDSSADRAADTTVLTGPDTDATPPVAPAPATSGPAYVIDGAAVLSVVQYSGQGRSGWRSIQTLDTGQRITIETSMVNLNDPNAMDQGAVTVSTSAGQSVGTTRILDLLITIRGAVDVATMRGLLALLIERA